MATTQQPKNVREREVKKYRLRQDRIVGLYLADDIKVPTQVKMVAELAKLITGLTAPEIKDRAEAAKSNVANV